MSPSSRCRFAVPADASEPPSKGHRCYHRDVRDPPGPPPCARPLGDHDRRDVRSTRAPRGRPRRPESRARDVRPDDGDWCSTPIPGPGGRPRSDALSDRHTDGECAAVRQPAHAISAADDVTRNDADAVTRECDAGSVGDASSEPEPDRGGRPDPDDCARRRLRRDPDSCPGREADAGAYPTACRQTHTPADPQPTPPPAPRPTPEPTTQPLPRPTPEPTTQPTATPEPESTPKGEKGSGGDNDDNDGDDSDNGGQDHKGDARDNGKGGGHGDATGGVIIVFPLVLGTVASGWRRRASRSLHRRRPGQ